MKTSCKKPLPATVSAVLCGLATLAFNYLLIPAVCVGWPDALWIGLRFVLPVVLAAVLLKGKRPAWVLVGLPVQWAVLALGASFIAPHNGYSLAGPFGDWAYAWNMLLWTVLVTLAQWVVLVLLKIERQGRE